jgi:hypothetical protein
MMPSPWNGTSILRLISAHVATSSSVSSILLRSALARRAGSSSRIAGAVAQIHATITLV